MDPNEGVGTVVSTQNLSDLQNYLVTFNKEIEGGDPSAIPVITDPDGSDPVGDIYTTGSVSQSLQSVTDSTGVGHFSTSFYSEQSLLDTSLGDDTSQNIHSLVNNVDGVDNDIVAQIKQEAANIDLDDASMAAVHAQLASLTGSISDITGSPQELIMTSVGDGLEAHEGKVIRIVSLGQDGSILSLGDGSQMQILGEEALQGVGEIKDSPVTLESLSQSAVMNSDSQGILDMDSSSGITIPVTSISSTLASLQTTGETGDSITLMADADGNALQSQLVAVTPGEDITADTLQQVIGFRSDSVDGNPVMLNTANALQTVAIVPSEGENGEVNYILIVSQPDGANKVLVTQGISLDMNTVLNLKEAGELTEEMIEEDGTTKRILKIIPKRLFTETGTELMCHYCNYTSPKRYLLTRHMKSHSEDRPHKCDICSRGFKTYASLTNHINTHTGTRPHKCKQCDAAFTTSGELVRHVRYRHTFEKPHKCPECDYASVELSKLKRHLRSHTGERPYQCPTCSYASPDTYKLKRHMRIHTGEKPYQCNICHARFTQSNSLKAHKLIHSGNKPVFQCQFCPTTCGRKTDLKIHMQKLHYSDQPVTCRKCGESFPDRYHFKLHMKTHEGEKCFKCDLCDYAACSQPHLESHILTHSGVKPFKCDECDHAFRQKQLLKRHKNLHHTADYQPPTPRDKNHDCSACDKSFAHRGNLLRHMAQHESGEVSDGENSAMSGDGGVGEGGLRTVTADHILHGDLMQDWREGKLGNAPQVVIVHPDGRIEEVTPKLQLPPDRSASDSYSDSKLGKGFAAKSSRMVGSSVADKVRVTCLTQPDLTDSDDDGNQREAGTQVELETDSDEVDDEEEDSTHGHDPESGSQQVKDVLTPEQLLHDLQSGGHGDSGSLSAILEGGGVTLYSAGSSSDLESVIASLPLDTTPATLEQPLQQSSEQTGEIPTIDAPEILAHLGFSTKLIKQEKVDDEDYITQTSTPITISLLPHPPVMASLEASKAKTSLLSVKRSQPTSAEAVVTTGLSGTMVVTMPKLLSSIAGGSSAGQVITIQTKPAERKTRSMKKKEEVEQASPAKRTRKALAEQGYTYI